MNNIAGTVRRIQKDIDQKKGTKKYQTLSVLPETVEYLKEKQEMANVEGARVVQFKHIIQCGVEKVTEEDLKGLYDKFMSADQKFSSALNVWLKKNPGKSERDYKLFLIHAVSGIEE